MRRVRFLFCVKKMGEAIDLYVLYHWVELWDWFAYLGTTDPLPALSRDMSALVT